MHVAALNGNLQLCKELIRGGSEWDVRDSFSKTPETLAIEHGHVQCALFLKNIQNHVEIKLSKIPSNKGETLRDKMREKRIDFTRSVQHKRNIISAVNRKYSWDKINQVRPHETLNPELYTLLKTNLVSKGDDVSNLPAVYPSDRMNNRIELFNKEYLDKLNQKLSELKELLPTLPISTGSNLIPLRECGLTPVCESLTKKIFYQSAKFLYPEYFGESGLAKFEFYFIDQNENYSQLISGGDIIAEVSLADGSANFADKNLSEKTKEPILLVVMTPVKSYKYSWKLLRVDSTKDTFDLVLDWLKITPPESYDDTDETGKSILHYCVIYQEYEAVNLLLVSGLSPFVYDDHGLVPIHYAVCSDDDECLNILLPYYSHYLDIPTTKNVRTLLVDIHSANQTPMDLALSAKYNAKSCAKILEANQ